MRNHLILRWAMNALCGIRLITILSLSQMLKSILISKFSDTLNGQILCIVWERKIRSIQDINLINSMINTIKTICAIKEMKNRNLLYQSTAQEIPQPDGKNSVYCGFDPTAPSLHLGNLVSILNLVRFDLLSYQPIALIGGATAQLGDPSGKKTERDQLNKTIIEQNSVKINSQIEHIYRNTWNHLMRNKYSQDSSPHHLKIINNKDFYEGINILDFVASNGRYFRMNSLLAKDHIASRLQDQGSGLSFTEFFYTILQSYDFQYLFKNHDCILQIGGSDQWGNITNGCDLIKKLYQIQAYGITTPLLLDKQGQKFGKSEGNAIWLDQCLTSSDEVRQYITNISDDQIIPYLKMLTFIPLEMIDEIESKHKEQPHLRIAQDKLSEELISMIHGDSQSQSKQRASKLFNTNFQDFRQQSEEAVLQFFQSEQWDSLTEIKQEELRECQSLMDLLIKYKIRSSKSEIKRSIEGGGLYINDTRIQLQEAYSLEGVLSKHLLAKRYMVIRFGKKEYKIIKIVC